jgi:hypothetical protein
MQKSSRRDHKVALFFFVAEGNQPNNMEKYVLYVGMTVSETVVVEWHWTFMQFDMDRW